MSGPDVPRKRKPGDDGDMRFFLQNKDLQVETVECDGEAEAFEITVTRNRRDRSACWKAYTERGELIYGLYQNNESGQYKTVCVA